MASGRSSASRPRTRSSPLITLAPSSGGRRGPLSPYVAAARPDHRGRHRVPRRLPPDMRPDGRRPDEMRPVTIEPGAVAYAEGSALVAFGDTRVLCAASVEERVPPYRKGTGAGWITAEYAMLPRSTQVRTERDGRRGRVDGRAQEIQRLIGRSLRAAIDLDSPGQRTIVVDCDVLQADGGTRTAAITGGYVALALAIDKLREAGLIRPEPIPHPVPPVSAAPLPAPPPPPPPHLP